MPSLVFILFFVFCFGNASLHAISLADYTVTNDCDSVLCALPMPEPMDTFDARYDDEMCIKLYLENVSPGDTAQFTWYYEGDLYYEGEPHLFVDSGVRCLSNAYPIKHTAREYMTGYWSIEVFVNGLSRMNTSFYLEGLPIPTTSSTSSISTTTTSYSPNPCMMSLIYGEPSEETDLMRYFRDNVLSQTAEGRELIKLYYLWSPVVVRAMQQDEEFMEEIKQMIDGILPMIKKEVE